MSQSSYTMKMKNTLVEYKKICSPDSTNFTIMKNLLKRASQFKNISNI